jgi:hypothetical protein
MEDPKFEPGNPTECEVRDCVECKYLLKCAECDDAWTDDTLEEVRILAFVSALVQIGDCSKADEDKFLKTFQIRMNAERAKCSSADIEWVKNAIKLHRAKDRLLNYEVFIGEMLSAIAERKEELDNAEVLDDFEKGRQLAYWEVMEIINNRYEIIKELLEEEK